jgi:hypothetical protein
MAPKTKLSDKLRALRRSLSPSHRDPEEGEFSDEENNPPLNQEGALNPTFDPIVASPASKGKSQASSSATTREENITARDVYILEKQANQEEQLRQLFSLVNSLGSEVRSVIKVVAENEEQRKDDNNKSGPSRKDTGKAASRSVSFADLEEDDREVKDDGNNNDDGNSDSDYDVGDYVSHAFYRDRIAEGFDKRAPSRLASNKPAYYPIDDSVTRTLTASKYSAKAAEYSITVAHAFFAAVTRTALDDGIAAIKDGDDKTAAILFTQVSNNMAAIEDLHRDRMLFLDLTSDPNATAPEKDYANNVLRNEFAPGVQNKGGSAKANKNFAAYQQQFLKATQFASAKATANRHLASSTGYGSGTSSDGRGAQAPNPNSNTQKKKAAARERPKAAGERAGAAGAGQAKQRERKAQPEGEE